MTGPSRTSPGDFDFDPGEAAQSSETAGDPLAWQCELDVAIADIDSRLKHPRRRATDAQPGLPQPGQPAITADVIDQIAWRVAEILRKDGTGPVQPEEMAAAISRTVASTPPPRVEWTAAPPEAPPLPKPRRLPHGIAISLRIRRPFFRWPFGHRRRQAMITLSDYRVY